MRALRDQRGQTTAEYVGVILVVGAILAAIAASGVGQTLTAKLEAAACLVASDGESCGEGEGGERPGDDPAGEPAGPAPALDPPGTSTQPDPVVRTTPVFDGGEPPGYDCFEPYVDPEENPTIPLSPCQREFETERDGGEYLETPEEYNRSLDELPFPLPFLAPRGPLDFIPGGTGFRGFRELFKRLGPLFRRGSDDAADKLRRQRQLQRNKEAGDRYRDDVAREFPGSQREVSRGTDLGTRRIDVLTPDGRAIESKLGRTSLSQDVEKQIAKDVRLRRRGDEVRELEWRFGQSPRTGKCGPTRPLREALEAADIDIVEDC